MFAESATDVARYLDTYVVCKNRFLRMKHFIWQSTPVQVSDPMTGRTGSVREVVLDVRGMIRQLEVDVGLTADAAWDMASDRQVCTAQRPVAGQAVQWVTEGKCFSCWIFFPIIQNLGLKIPHFAANCNDKLFLVSEFEIMSIHDFLALSEICSCLSENYNFLTCPLLS